MYSLYIVLIGGSVVMYIHVWDIFIQMYYIPLTAWWLWKTNCDNIGCFGILVL